MNTELDKVKSTITISLGTKNRLRKLKGGASYEEYINFLIRAQNNLKNSDKNYIELQTFTRKKGVFSFKNFKIMFSYNEYNKSENFFFDIAIETVRKNGDIISIANCIKELSDNTSKSPLETEYLLYFELLKTAIRLELDSLFEHKGRFEDYYMWEQETQRLNISKKVYNEDILEKLEKYQSGVHIFSGKD